MKWTTEVIKVRLVQRPFGAVLDLDAREKWGEKGVVVDEVNGHSADAGIRRGDLLVTIGGIPVSQMGEEQVLALLGKHELPLDVVVMRERPQARASHTLPLPPDGFEYHEISLLSRPLGVLLDMSNKPDLPIAGFVVTKATGDAAKRGVKKGDVLVRIAGAIVADIEDLMVVNLMQSSAMPLVITLMRRKDSGKQKQKKKVQPTQMLAEYRFVDVALTQRPLGVQVSTHITERMGSKGFSVTAVRGHAENLGLRKDDLVVRICGQSADAMNTTEITNILATHPVPIPLVVLQPTHEFVEVLVLSRPIGMGLGKSLLECGAHSGLEVLAVSGHAVEQGIQPHDVLVRIGRVKVGLISQTDITKQLTDSELPLTLALLRPIVSERVDEAGEEKSKSHTAGEKRKFELPVNHEMIQLTISERPMGLGLAPVPSAIGSLRGFAVEAVKGHAKTAGARKGDLVVSVNKRAAIAPGALDEIKEGPLPIRIQLLRHNNKSETRNSQAPVPVPKGPELLASLLKPAPPTYEYVPLELTARPFGLCMENEMSSGGGVGGVRVAETQSGGHADTQGIREYDLIVALGISILEGMEVTDVMELLQGVETPVTVTVLRRKADAGTTTNPFMKANALGTATKFGTEEPEADVTGRERVAMKKSALMFTPAGPPLPPKSRSYSPVRAATQDPDPHVTPDSMSRDVEGPSSEDSGVGTLVSEGVDLPGIGGLSGLEGGGYGGRAGRYGVEAAVGSEQPRTLIPTGDEMDFARSFPDLALDMLQQLRATASRLRRSEATQRWQADERAKARGRIVGQLGQSDPRVNEQFGVALIEGEKRHTDKASELLSRRTTIENQSARLEAALQTVAKHELQRAADQYAEILSRIPTRDLAALAAIIASIATVPRRIRPQNTDVLRGIKGIYDKAAEVQTRLLEPRVSDWVEQVGLSPKAIQKAPIRPLPQLLGEMLAEGHAHIAEVPDVIRVAIACREVVDISRTLQVINGDPHIVISAVKNRFDASFDAWSETGGFRDVIVNFSFRADIEAIGCEMRLQLVSMGQVATRTRNLGHRISKQVDLAAHLTSTTEALDPLCEHLVKTGVMRQLAVDCVRGGVAPAPLIRCLKDPGCGLTALSLMSSLQSTHLLSQLQRCLSSHPLPSLRSLNLSHNPLLDDATLIAFSLACSNLVNINVSHTTITDRALTEGVRACKKLEMVNLSYCGALTDTGVTTLVLATRHLQTIIASYTRIGDESVSAIASNLSGGLVELDINMTRASDLGVGALLDCRLLEVLCLRGTKVTDATLVLLASQLHSLSVLDIANTYVSSNAIARISASCRNLHEVWLSHLAISDEAFGELLSSVGPSLRKLGAAYVSEVTDQALGRLSVFCSAIEQLHLAGTQISNKSVTDIAAQCPHLTDIDLTSTAITDTGAGILCRSCPQLVSLVLSGTAITDSLAGHLALLPKLQSVELATTHVGDQTVDSLSRLQSLTSMNLNRTHITNKSLRVLTSRHPLSLVSLSIAHTELTPSIILEAIYAFPMLRAIDVSGIEAWSDVQVVEMLPNCPLLVSLSLGLCNIGDAAAHAIAKNAPQLTTLELDACKRLTDGGIVEIARACSFLQNVSVTHTHISDRSLNALIKCCPQLRELGLANCDTITNKGLASLEFGTQLRRIDVQGCPKISKPDVQALRSRMPGTTVAI